MKFLFRLTTWYILWIGGVVNPVFSQQTGAFDSLSKFPTTRPLHLKKAEKVGISINGYAELIYAQDYNNPVNRIRKFGSNPARVNQFDVAYAYLQATYENHNLKATFSAHFGGIADVMYASEPAPVKAIRELSFSYQLSPKLSLLAGIYPAMYGFESFINKENLFATRAVMTDFAPDFTAGLRLTWNFAGNWFAKFEISNGWQIIRDNNQDKSYGLVLTYEKKGKLIFNHGTLFGNEQADSLPKLYRFYNNLFAKINCGKRWIIAPMVDIGFQQAPAFEGGWHTWISYGLGIRYALGQKWALAARYERLYDPQNIIPELVTRTPNGFRLHGATLTLEHCPSEWLTIRLENRIAINKDAIYTTERPGVLSREDFFTIISAAIAF